MEVWLLHAESGQSRRLTGEAAESFNAKYLAIPLEDWCLPECQSVEIEGVGWVTLSTPPLPLDPASSQ